MNIDEIAILTSQLRQGWDKKLIFDLNLEPNEIFEECLEESLASFSLKPGWDTLIIRLRCHMGYNGQNSRPGDIFELLKEAEGFLNILESSDELPDYVELCNDIIDEIAGNVNYRDAADDILKMLREKYKLIPR